MSSNWRRFFLVECASVGAPIFTFIRQQVRTILNMVCWRRAPAESCLGCMHLYPLVRGRQTVPSSNCGVEIGEWWSISMRTHLYTKPEELQFNCKQIAFTYVGFRRGCCSHSHSTNTGSKEIRFILNLPGIRHHSTNSLSTLLTESQDANELQLQSVHLSKGYHPHIYQYLLLYK